MPWPPARQFLTERSVPWTPKVTAASSACRNACTCAPPARALSRKYASFTSLSIFFTATATTFAKRLCSSANSSRNVCFTLQNGLEGIVAKRADSPYVSDRSPYWVKLKSTKTVDAVVGGWTESRTSALPFGSLLLGLYQGKKLRFIGHVGSGFDARKLKELSNRLKELAAACPFDTLPETNEKPSWVSPALVARVKFS